MNSGGERSLILTNDDGIDAPGLRALWAATEGLGRRRVVAPLSQFSSFGHGVTTHRPIPIDRRSEDRYAIDGTPADSVRIALHHVETGPCWVVAGINPGGNLGSDVHHSGTVAAAREAALRGRPAVAVSHYIARGRQIDWDRAARWTAAVLGDLVERPLPPGAFWGVNLPHPGPDASFPEVVFCPLDPSPLPLAFLIDEEGRSAHYSGDYQARDRVPGSDVDVCFGGRIAVTLIRAY